LPENCQVCIIMKFPNISHELIMQQPLIFETIGNVELLSQNKIALFASKTAPGVIEAEALKLIETLAGTSFCFASGWQAPLEKKLFHSITRQNWNTNIIYYLAKDINTFTPNAQQESLLQENRLLVIAPQFNQNRADLKQVNKRDELLFEQVKKILFLSITQGGRLEKYLLELSRKTYQLFILDNSLNQNFFADDITPLNVDNAELLLQT